MLTHDQYRDLARICVTEAINSICDEGKIPSTREQIENLIAYAMTDFDTSGVDWAQRNVDAWFDRNRNARNAS